MNVPAVVAYLGDCRSATAMPLTDIIPNDHSYSRFSSTDRELGCSNTKNRITKENDVAFNKKGKKMQSFVFNYIKYQKDEAC